MLRSAAEPRRKVAVVPRRATKWVERAVGELLELARAPVRASAVGRGLEVFEQGPRLAGDLAAADEGVVPFRRPGPLQQAHYDARQADQLVVPVGQEDGLLHRPRRAALDRVMLPC